MQLERRERLVHVEAREAWKSNIPGKTIGVCRLLKEFYLYSWSKGKP